MKRSAIIISIALLDALAVQAADAALLRHAHISSCLARQRADLAPLDSYGGTLPGFAPAIMQQIMNPVIHNIRTRCMPTTNEEDMGWDTKQPEHRAGAAIDATIELKFEMFETFGRQARRMT